jgi:hypothetical protein
MFQNENYFDRNMGMHKSGNEIAKYTLYFYSSRVYISHVWWYTSRILVLRR